MNSSTTTQTTLSPAPAITIGIDLGDRVSQACALDAEGRVIERFPVASDRASFEERFRGRPRSRVVMEVGTMSPWASRALEALGHEVIVANSRRLPRVHVKTDRIDAERLARWARVDVGLLHPVRHRSERTQGHLTILRARDAAVRARTKLINVVRGSAKSIGMRVPGCAPSNFPERATQSLTPSLLESLSPLLVEVKSPTRTIGKYDVRIRALCRKEYAASTILFREVDGVGYVTALAYTLVVESPERIRKSRSVGAYLGLTPRTLQSGDIDPQLSISHDGDPFLRRLLVSCAQSILRPGARDCALRRFGLRLAAVGGRAAKKRAAVAVARRLAVLMHTMWKTGEVYDRWRGLDLATVPAAS